MELIERIEKETDKLISDYGMYNLDASDKDARNNKIRSFTKMILTDKFKLDEEIGKMSEKLIQEAPLVRLGMTLRDVNQDETIQSYIKSRDMLRAPVGDEQHLLTVVYVLLCAIAKELTGKSELELITKKKDTTNENEGDFNEPAAFAGSKRKK